MIEEINRLRKENESLGGTFEVRAFGLVPGLGSHISWEERLDGRIAQAMVSIQSIKGVSIGPGLGGRGLARAPTPTTRSSTTTSAATGARRTGPAAWRAA